MEIRDEGIEENLDFLSTDDPSDSMSTGLFGLHASFTLSDDSLSKVAEAIPEGAGVHIHVAEGPEDEEQCQAEHGMRIVQRLDSFNLLRERSVLAHCLHINEEEKDLVADSKTMVVHNPRSNMNNGVGVFDMDGFLKRGITVGLGTDGIGANMLTELFTAGILQKVSTGNSLAAGFGDLQKILFDNNPQIASTLLGAKLGRIAPGYAADIALFDYDPPTPIDAGNVLGHLLFGIAVHDMHVSDLIVSGSPVIRDGHFANIDENKTYSKAREVAAKLWGRIS
jgi:cytosine/adenosine deaminase-related metal-dependent hydrolase